MSLAPVLSSLGIGQREFSRGTGMSLSAVNRLVTLAQWPIRRPGAARASAEKFLRGRGASAAQVLALFAPAKKLAPECLQHAEAVPLNPETTEAIETQEEDSMLLKNETLTPQARKHFSLARSPFVDDINSRQDVFASQHGRYVRAAMLEAATNHGFIAIIGQSGSGKSTLREDLEERIREERRPVVLIKPYIHGMEPSQANGKPLRSGHIAEAIVDALAPGVPLKSSPQARYKQVHELLKASRSAGYTHLLVIEEAHRLPIPTLKHLKNFMELKDGLRRLLGVCLIGQNELYNTLSERNPEVREIVQRCEQITMEPLDNDVEAYLQLKFERAGTTLAAVFEPDAMDAIRARLIQQAHGHRANEVVSICYPQVVNNLVCRALNAAAAVGFAKVDAQVVAGC